MTGLFAILFCQLLGEVIAYEASLPVPGPVLGMVLLMGVLRLAEGRKAAGGLATGIFDSGGTILKHLSLLFIPAGVGVVQRLDIITAHGVGLIVTVVVSTIITLVVTAFAFIAAARLLPGGKTGEADHG